MIEIVLNGETIQHFEKSLCDCEEAITKYGGSCTGKYGLDSKCIAIPNSSLFGMQPTTAYIHYRNGSLFLIAFVWPFLSERPTSSEIRRRRTKACTHITKALGVKPKPALPIMDRKIWRLRHIKIVYEIIDRFGFEEHLTITFDEKHFLNGKAKM